MVPIVAALVIAFLLAIPLIWVVRSERRLTWTGAVLLGTLLTAIGLILVADVPSRLLYYFDAQHGSIAARLPAGFLRNFIEGDDYIVVRDIIVNTVQGVFAVGVIAAAYIWGERHRRQGRFSK